jgi:hypothetical protein
MEKKLTRKEAVKELIKSRFEEGKEIFYIDFEFPIVGSKEGLTSFINSLIDEDDE